MVASVGKVSDTRRLLNQGHFRIQNCEGDVSVAQPLPYHRTELRCIPVLIKIQLNGRIVNYVCGWWILPKDMLPEIKTLKQ